MKPLLATALSALLFSAPVLTPPAHADDAVYGQIPVDLDVSGVLETTTAIAVICSLYEPTRREGDLPRALAKGLYFLVKEGVPVEPGPYAFDIVPDFETVSHVEALVPVYPVSDAAEDNPAQWATGDCGVYVLNPGFGVNKAEPTMLLLPAQYCDERPKGDPVESCVAPDFDVARTRFKFTRSGAGE